MQMRTFLLMVCVFAASGAFGADCVTTPLGKVVCKNGQNAAVVNPNTGTVTTNQQNSTAIKITQGNAATQGAYNPNTGNAAVSQTNQNGVTTTQTLRGGEAKTKNGKAVAQGPNGTVCVKGSTDKGCTQK
jgi:hypothetical protein